MGYGHAPAEPMSAVRLCICPDGDSPNTGRLIEAMQDHARASSAKASRCNG